MSSQSSAQLLSTGRCCTFCHEDREEGFSEYTCYHWPPCCCCQEHFRKSAEESRLPEAPSLIDRGRLSYAIYRLVMVAQREFPAEGFSSTHASAIADFIERNFVPKPKGEK